MEKGYPHRVSDFWHESVKNEKNPLKRTGFSQGSNLDKNVTILLGNDGYRTPSNAWLEGALAEGQAICVRTLFSDSADL